MDIIGPKKFEQIFVFVLSQLHPSCSLDPAGGDGAARWGKRGSGEPQASGWSQPRGPRGERGEPHCQRPHCQRPPAMQDELRGGQRHPSRSANSTEWHRAETPGRWADKHKDTFNTSVQSGWRFEGQSQCLLSVNSSC